jgi:hypothetical protein
MVWLTCPGLAIAESALGRRRAISGAPPVVRLGYHFERHLACTLGPSSSPSSIDATIT